jgi:hypothetical protein
VIAFVDHETPTPEQQSAVDQLKAELAKAGKPADIVLQTPGDAQTRALEIQLTLPCRGRKY